MVDIAKFEVFDRKGVKARGKNPAPPSMTIHGRGTISLNRPAIELLGNPSDVLLLYSREMRTIGLRGVPANSPHSYPLRQQKGGKSRLISASAFLKHYGIDLGRLTHLPAQLEDGMLTASLPQLS